AASGHGRTGGRGVHHRARRSERGSRPWGGQERGRRSGRHGGASLRSNATRRCKRV
ncbi:MAG: hypothetical protein AVDCRST_MAG03-3695, partial [uncultured Rubrobacteraceae bacterium]